MDWVVGLKVRALSMSLGLPGYREDFRVLTQRLRALNILPVFAVGNEGPGTSRYPGNYPEALSVGAFASDNTVADFSSSERFNRPYDPLVPDLVGPGVDVLSCIPGNKYAQMSGTSMATPHIAGLAALLFQANPGATADQVEAEIFRCCQLPRTMVVERANRGVPDGPCSAGMITTGEGKPKKPAPTKRAPKKPVRKSTAKKKRAPKRPVRKLTGKKARRRKSRKRR
jgi:subtilisin family serine protease